ncbi:hypothetical protein BX616_008316 [Lobosporangium transversale]|nr:hypothetical protein BX616_008316 [Lobosporangium transversale]
MDERQYCRHVINDVDDMSSEYYGLDGPDEETHCRHLDITNKSQNTRPLQHRAFSSSAASSAQLKSQACHTCPRPDGGDSMGISQSHAGMPKLNRHPYASELVRSSSPDEVK